MLIKSACAFTALSDVTADGDVTLPVATHGGVVSNGIVDRLVGRGSGIDVPGRTEPDRFGLMWRGGTQVLELVGNVTHFHPSYVSTHVDKVCSDRIVDLPDGLPPNFPPSMFPTQGLCSPDDVGVVTGVSVGGAYQTRVEIHSDAPLWAVTVVANPGGGVTGELTHSHADEFAAGQAWQWVYTGHIPEAFIQYCEFPTKVGHWVRTTVGANTHYQTTAMRYQDKPYLKTQTANTSTPVTRQYRLDPFDETVLRQTWPPFQVGRNRSDREREAYGGWVARPAATTAAIALWLDTHEQDMETVWEWGDGPDGYRRLPVERPWVRYGYDTDLGFVQILSFEGLLLAKKVRAPGTGFSATDAAVIELPFEGDFSLGVEHGLQLIIPEDAALWSSVYADHQLIAPYTDVLQVYDANRWDVLLDMQYRADRDSLVFCRPCPTPRIHITPGDWVDVGLEDAGLQALQYDPAWPLRTGECDPEWAPQSPHTPGRIPQTAAAAVLPEPDGWHRAIYTSGVDGIWVRWYQRGDVAFDGYFEALGLDLIEGKTPWVWGCSHTPNEIIVLAWDLHGVLGWTLLAVTLPGPPDEMSRSTQITVEPYISDVVTGESYDDVRPAGLSSVGTASIQSEGGDHW